VCAHTCSFCFWHDQAHSSFYSCLPRLSLSLNFLPRFLPLCSFRYGVPALFCAMLPYTHTGWQNGLGLRQRMWPGGSPRGIGSSSWVMRRKKRCYHMVQGRSCCFVSNFRYDCWFLFVPSPSLFFALSPFAKSPLNEIYVIRRYMSFSKWSLSFCCLHFHAFRWSQLLTEKNEWKKKKKSEREREERERSSGPQRTKQQINKERNEYEGGSVFLVSEGVACIVNKWDAVVCLRVLLGYVVRFVSGNNFSRLLQFWVHSLHGGGSWI